MCEVEERNVQLQSGTEPEQTSVAGSRVTLAAASTTEQTSAAGSRVTLAAPPTTEQTNNAGSRVTLTAASITEQTSSAGSRVTLAAAPTLDTSPALGSGMGPQACAGHVNEKFEETPGEGPREISLIQTSKSTNGISQALAEKKSSGESVASTQRLPPHQQEADTGPPCVALNTPEVFEHKLNAGERPYECTKCSKSFKALRNLEEHQLVHTDVRAYNCTECGKSFKYLKTLKKHSKTHSRKHPYRCRQCSGVCKTARSFQNHQQRHHSSQPGRCDPGQAAALAEKGFVDEAVASTQNLLPQQEPDTGPLGVSQHKPEILHEVESAQIVGLGKYHCRPCQKSFTFKSSLQRHRRTGACQQNTVALSEKKSGDESVASTQNLLCHQQEPDIRPLSASGHQPEASSRKRGKDSSDILSYQCPECSISFKTSRSLKLHSIVHTDVHAYICTDCDKSFKYPTRSRKHRQTQSERRLYRCHQCSTSFRTTRSIGDHQRRRRDIQPERCFVQIAAIAEKKSSDESVQNLSCHQRELDTGPLSVSHQQPEAVIRPANSTKSDLRPYKCAECNETFERGSHLERHWAMHIGYCPYRCSECGETFSERRSWKRHMLLHSEKKSSDASVVSAQNRLCPEQEAGTGGPLSASLLDSPLPQLRKKSEGNEHRYQCKECGKSFKLQRSLIRHNLSHTGERPYECLQCHKTFKMPSDLRGHLRRHVGERPYQCNECGKSFKDKCVLDIHRRIHTDERPYKCTHCNRSFRHLMKFKMHQLVHTGERAYQCTQCSKSFKGHHQLKAHSLCHRAERPHKCTECDKSFASRPCWRQHMRYHANRDAFHCAECDKRYVTRLDFDDHQRQHHSSQPEHCDSVQAADLAERKSSDESVACMQNLARNDQQEADTRPHSSVQHKPNGLTETESSIRLDVHQQQTEVEPVQMSTDTPTVTGSQAVVGKVRYQCTECNKSYWCKTYLKCHMRMHKGEHPHQCPECGKSFPYSCKLKAHRRSHTGERRYRCKECDKSFMHSVGLKRHSLFHTGEMLYPCTECSQRFGSWNNLKRHHLTHTGEKQHRCKQCNTQFTQVTDYREHKLKHAGKHPFHCTECDRSFRRSGRLKWHLLHHKEQRRCTESGPANGQRLRKKRQQARRRKRRNETPICSYVCMECNSLFASKTGFLDHQRLCQSSQLQHCPVPAGALADKKSTGEQMGCHTGSSWSFEHLQHSKGQQTVLGKDLVYKCRHCVKVFTDSQSVREHVLAAHVPVEAQFGCGGCASSFELVHEAMACYLGHGRTVCVMLDRIDYSG